MTTHQAHTLNARTAADKETTTMQTTTHRPTIGNTVALGRFSPEGPKGYAAVYNDGTHGPTRSTREEAERDYHIPPIETLQTMKDPAHAVRQSPEAQALINAAADDDPGEEHENMKLDTNTTCHECGDKVEPGDEWYIYATADQEVYGECCVEACDICGTTDKIGNLVEVFAEVAPNDIRRYHCQECHEETQP